MTWCRSFILCLVLQCTSGVAGTCADRSVVCLTDCKNGYVSIEENSKNPISCKIKSGNQPMTWTISKTFGGKQIFNETYSDQEQTVNYEDISLSHLDDTYHLTITGNYRDFGDTLVRCAAGVPVYLCQIRIFKQGQRTNCTFNVTTGFSGSCHIENMFASDNIYACRWDIFYPKDTVYLLPKPVPSTLIVAPVTASGQLYFTGTCGFWYPRPGKNGTFTFDLTVTPGTQERGVGTIKLPEGYTEPPQAVFEPMVIMVDTTPLTLRCNTSTEFTSPSNYTWTGVNCDEGNHSKNCTFTPHSGQNKETVVTCSATFTDSAYGGQVVAVSVVLKHKIPAATPTTANVETAVTQTATDHTSLTTPSSYIPNTSSASGDNRILNTGSTGHGHSSDTEGSPPVGAIGGGVGAFVIAAGVTVIVVIFLKRRRGSKREADEPRNDVFEEQQNVSYERGDNRYEINDAYQAASSDSTVQKQPAATTVDPTYEDHNLDSYDDGYAAVSAGSPQENGNVFQTHTQSSLDHDLYSSVDAPTSNIPAAVSGPAAQGDEYAVVEKSVKGHTEPSFQPDVYAQVNKSRPKTGGDVYAQVNKPAKRANSSPMQHDIDEGDGNYAEVQKPKPNLKPKPALKPKPTAAVKPNPKSTSGLVETSGGDDEYNVLRFQGRNSDTPANPDAGQLYSHIGSDI